MVLTTVTGTFGYHGVTQLEKEVGASQRNRMEKRLRMWHGYQCIISSIQEAMITRKIITTMFRKGNTMRMKKKKKRVALMTTMNIGKMMAKGKKVIHAMSVNPTTAGTNNWIHAAEASVSSSGTTARAAQSKRVSSSSSSPWSSIISGRTSSSTKASATAKPSTMNAASVTQSITKTLIVGLLGIAL